LKPLSSLEAGRTCLIPYDTYEKPGFWHIPPDTSEKPGFSRLRLTPKRTGAAPTGFLAELPLLFCGSKRSVRRGDVPFAEASLWVKPALQ
jgi:hypothetical protein